MEDEFYTPLQRSAVNSLDPLHSTRNNIVRLRQVDVIPSLYTYQSTAGVVVDSSLYVDILGSFVETYATPSIRGVDFSVFLHLAYN